MSATFLRAVSQLNFVLRGVPRILFVPQLPRWTQTFLVRHADSRVLATTMNQRRYTNNKDVLWVLSHLSQHGKILKLKLGFAGRRSLRMSTRDSDFLNALKGVKTDELFIGCPDYEESTRFDVRFSPCSLCQSGLFARWEVLQSSC